MVHSSSIVLHGSFQTLSENHVFLSVSAAGSIKPKIIVSVFCCNNKTPSAEYV